jgi:endonuclease G
MNDTAFRPGQDAVLEAIVLPKLRPVAFIKEDSFDDLPDPWAHVALFRDALKPVIRAIGRVEVQNAGVPFGGTGFLCGPGLILTNRHVAEIFTYGVGGPSRLKFIPGRTARWETGHERQPSAGFRFKVLKPLMVHPHWDAALLEVKLEDESAQVPEEPKLCATVADAAAFADRDVVVIGYPYWSDQHDPALMAEVFGGVYGVKRLQPGKLMRIESIESYGHAIEALLHDASTLGGNSGSAVVDLKTQQVVALHFAGTYLVANYSIPMWDLARDARMVAAGLNFTPALTVAAPRIPEDGGPAWLSAWKDLEQTLAGPGQPVSPPPAAGPEPLPPARSSLIDPGWFERYSDEELRRLYQRDPEQFRSLLAASFSPEEAQDLYDTLLFDASVEGVRERAADPTLPEIILLPGILGSHLRGGFWGRSWLNPLTLPFSNLLQTLGLDANGNDPNNLVPDGYVEMSYARAARAWRREGFMVHEFSFDWRRPLAQAARRLDSFMRERRRSRREARFALVCHSMGSLVSAIYARDVADWREFVDHAVFCGGPLGGSFAIMEILSGEFPFVRKINKISQHTNLDDMRQMGASFPGALEMLPHPALFTHDGADAELLYRPESYAPFARPGADWLQASRRIKDDLRTTPLLGRVTCLVCVDRPTAGTFVIVNREVRHSDQSVRGDDTVPAVSALVPGVPAYRVDNMHSDLLKDPKVLDAVPRILRNERLPMESVTTAILKQPLPEAPAPSAEALAPKWEAEAASIHERMRHGLTTADDLRWILSTE